MFERLNQMIPLLNAAGEEFWRFSSAMFVQTAILVGILAVLDLLLLRRLRASVRYAVWMLVLVKLVLPVSLSSPVSLARLVPVFESSHAEEAVAASDDFSLSSVGRDDLQEWHSDAVPANALSAHVHAGPPTSETGGTAATTAPATAAQSIAANVRSNSNPPAAPTRPTYERLHWKAWILTGWLGIVTVLFGVLVRRALYVRRIVGRSEPAPQELQSFLNECLDAARLRRARVRLRVTRDLGSPAICGFFRATVLFPHLLAGSLNRSQWRQVFAHELIHWKRCDLQVNSLQTVLQVLYFYHPFVWVANAVLRRLREQAVDEAVLVMLQAPVDEYSTTLLDVASYPRRPAELALNLTGVVESRKALAGRIRRMLTRPLPKKARLGMVGLTAVLLLGSVLLPMAPTDAPAADEQANAEAAGEQDAKGNETEDTGREAQEPKARDDGNQRKAVLSGRITDETGAPVDDAELTIYGRNVQFHAQTKTGGDGRYEFDQVPEAGEYRVQIASQRWVGIGNWDQQPILHLAPGKQVERHFDLKRACRLMIRAVDEEGNPVKQVPVMAASLADDRSRAPEPVHTDEGGVAILGGLAPSPVEYIVATMHNDYAFERQTILLDDPERFVSCDYVLKKGKDVKGTAVCSDGKPPAGWRILAMPSWWHFGRQPIGTVIAEDGSFTLPHIVPGKYKVTISIPSGKSGSSPRTVLSEAELFDVEGDLAVKLDHPSPASLVYIAGTLRFDGPPSDKGFWIFANSADRSNRSSTYVDAGEKEFRIGPAPPGKYTLEVRDVSIERVSLEVTAPADGVEWELKSKGQPQLTGLVVDAETGEPVTNFRVRLMKLHTLGDGPQFVQDDNWRQFQNDTGAFDVTLVGPGVYTIFVAADGFAPSHVDAINTVENAGKPVQVSLSRGVSLSGKVVNEEGDPVDGATVLPLPGEAGKMARTLKMLATHDGAATINGRFELDNLPPGPTTLLITHPDYRFAIVEDLVVSAEPMEPPIVTLTRGGTVRGHVYDAEGQPQAGVTLYFRDNNGFGGSPFDPGPLATVVTDANGYYVAEHLPEMLCYVSRDAAPPNAGVFRQTILPEKGRTHTLDFGGQTKLTGRLIVNGAPFAEGRLVLSGERPHTDIFMAYAQTMPDGSFAFMGIPPGEWTLYHGLPGQRTEWGRVRDVFVTEQGVDLGLIEHLTGTLTVHLRSPDGRDLSNARVTLYTYDPVWPSHSGDLGLVAPREAGEPYFIHQVPLGRHELVVSRVGDFQFRQMVEVTADTLDQTLEVSLPSGTASLSGRIDGRISDSGTVHVLKLWSTDETLFAYIRPNDDGTYRLNNIPAGDYFIRDGDSRDAGVLARFALQEGEQRTFDFTPETVLRDAAPRGYLMVSVFTNQGTLLPCEVTLRGPDGPVPVRTKYNGQRNFGASPGEYVLRASHPGFKPHRQTVEIRPWEASNRPAPGYEVHVRLQPEVE